MLNPKSTWGIWVTKLQDKGWDAPVLRTMMGAVQIIHLQWKKERKSCHLRNSTLWISCVLSYYTSFYRAFMADLVYTKITWTKSTQSLLVFQTPKWKKWNWLQSKIFPSLHYRVQGLHIKQVSNHLVFTFGYISPLPVHSFCIHRNSMMKSETPSNIH